MQSAFTAFEYLKDYSLDQRPGTLTEVEFARCFDEPYSKMCDLVKSRHIVDVWEEAQWVRVRDFKRWSGAPKSRITIWIDEGLITPRKADDRSNALLMKFSEALYLKKCLLLVEYARKGNGAYQMRDMESVAMLPLSTLLGLMTKKELFGMFFTTCAYGMHKKGAANG